MNDKPRARLRSGVVMGAMTAFLALGHLPATGCLLPDYCIVFPAPGRSICQPFINASGVDGEGDVVFPILDQFEVVRGCDCLTQDEADVLLEGDPESIEYQVLIIELEAKARIRCLEIADELGLIEHNCATAMSVDGEPFDDGPGPCIDGCKYIKPPPWGDCPPDDECSLGDATETGDDGTGTLGMETGSTTAPGQPI